METICPFATDDVDAFMLRGGMKGNSGRVVVAHRIDVLLDELDRPCSRTRPPASYYAITSMRAR